MSAYAGKQLEQKEDLDRDDNYKMKLEEALAQLDILASENMHFEESPRGVEADCSEEDAPHIVT